MRLTVAGLLTSAVVLAVFLLTVSSAVAASTPAGQVESLRIEPAAAARTGLATAAVNRDQSRVMVHFRLADSRERSSAHTPGLRGAPAVRMHLSRFMTDAEQRRRPPSRRALAR